MTELDQTGRTRRDLYAILDLYDAALEPARAGTGSRVAGTREAPLPISAHIIDTRAETITDLRYWARFILDHARTIDGEPLTAGPGGVNPNELVPFVARYVDWLATEMPDDAANLAEDTAKHAKALRDIYDPPRRDWMPIGDCPVTVADPDGNAVQCGTKVRAYPDKAFIECPGCGTEDTLTWWMSQIVPEGSDVAHADAVIACVTSRTFQPLPHGTLRQWASSGHIQRHGKDAKGRTLYSTRAVLAYAVDKTREGVA